MGTDTLTFLSSLGSTDKILLALGGATIVYLVSRTRGTVPTPPGPRPLPLVGNMFQIPQKDEWPVYEAWAKKYGPITYLTMLGTPMVVLNSLKVVRDLMEENSAIYSNRPLAAMKELCGLDWVIAYISGEPLRQESRVLVSNLLNSPDDVLDHIKQYTTSSILLGTYGYRISGADDPMVHEMERSYLQSDQLSGPLAFLIEVGHSLKNWPTILSLLGLKKTLDKIKQVFVACRVDPFMRTKQKINDGTAFPCFVSTTLDDIASKTSLSPEETKEKEELLMDCAASMFGAAVDSSSCTLHCFFALASLHPLVMRRAQEDIDHVTEGERLPTFDDWESLPYINAIILEVLRYNTIVPLGIPHATTKDDIYNGMFIPKGSMICANFWLIFRDPEVFVDPDSFKPERFLGDEGA